MEYNLPSLPEKKELGQYTSVEGFDEEQLEVYAIAAIEKDRAERQSVPIVKIIGYGKDYRPDEHETGEWRDEDGVCVEFADGYRDCFYVSDLLAAAPQPCIACGESAGHTEACARVRWGIVSAPQPQPARSGCTAGTGEECTQRGCATNCPAKPQPVQPVQGSKALFDCDVPPRPLAHPLKDYHHCITDGPLHYTWEDKPHRIVYDLIAAVRFYTQPAQGEKQ